MLEDLICNLIWNKWRTSTKELSTYLHFDLKSEAQDLVRLGPISIFPEDLGKTQFSHRKTLTITVDRFLP